LVSAAAQSEIWAQPKGSAQSAEPKVWTERVAEKFDFSFWLISGLTWFEAQKVKSPSFDNVTKSRTKGRWLLVS